MNNSTTTMHHRPASARPRRLVSAAVILTVVAFPTAAQGVDDDDPAPVRQIQAVRDRANQAAADYAAAELELELETLEEQAVDLTAKTQSLRSQVATRHARPRWLP